MLVIVFCQVIIKGQRVADSCAWATENNLGMVDLPSEIVRDVGHSQKSTYFSDVSKLSFSGMCAKLCD